MDEQPTVRVEPPAPPASPKRLYRPREDRLLLGVCVGLARYFDTDPVLLRAIFAVTTLLAGTGVVIYVVLALIMPNEDMLEADPRVAAQATVDEAADEIRRGIDRLADAVRGIFGKEKRGL